MGNLALVEKTETKTKKRGRPPGSKNKPGSQKPGPKASKVVPLPVPQAKKGNLSGLRTPPRRVDLPGSEQGIDISTFAGRLAAARLKADLTQEALGKSVDRTRQAIRQYEGGISEPAISVLEQLAKRLGVSATYLAFGEYAVKVNKPDEAYNVNEIAYINGRRQTTGSYVIPKTFAESLVEDIAGLRVYCLDHTAKLFDLNSGDRLFIDIRNTDMGISHDFYAIVIGGEMEVVRYEPSSGKGTIAYTNPKGTRVEVKAKDITVLGAIVGTIKRWG